MAANVSGVAYVPESRTTAWGAIFGGTFVYLGIMATFGALGGAIFASSGNVTGIGIWMTILGIIALFCGGRTVGRLARVTDKNTGVYLGMITFGMCIFATMLSLALVWNSVAMPAVGVVRWDIASLAQSGGWGLFVALFLGMLGCVGGASQAVPRSLATVTERPDLRRTA